MEPILTIDIGGTAIKFGVADETGRFLQKGSLPTRIREKGVDAFLADLLSLVRRVRNAFPITGIAVSLAGIVNGDTGELLLPSQFFPGLHRMTLVDFLEKETGLPALCENDVNCAALAEYWQGAGKGAHMLLCMTLGTGIGGALVHEGRLYRGASYAAGEVGQAYLGSSETWENWASVSALLTAAEIKRGLTLGSLTGQEFFAFVEKGEEMETHLLREWVDRWMVGIVSLAWIVNPDRIVIGGGISAQRKLLMPYLKAAFDAKMPAILTPHTTLSLAQFQNDAGMLGALYLYQQRRQEGKNDLTF